MKQFFIADLHIGHIKALSFDNSPFATIQKRDDMIAQNWNNTVSKGDEVYILGDLSWLKANETVEYFSKLNGTKYLITGNHDRKLIKDNKVQRLFKEITPYMELKQNGKTIVLCHYPIMFFNGCFKGNIHLFGHIHVSKENDYMDQIVKYLKENTDEPCSMVNVGCMMPWMNYTPRTLEEIIDYQK